MSESSVRFVPKGEPRDDDVEQSPGKSAGTPARWRVYWKPTGHDGFDEIERAVVVVSVNEGPNGEPAEYAFDVDTGRISTLRDWLLEVLLWTTHPVDRDWRPKGSFRTDGFLLFCSRAECRQNAGDFCDGELESWERSAYVVPECPDLLHSYPHRYVSYEDVKWARSQV